MGEDYYKAKYKALKKELRMVRTQTEEQRDSFQRKLDQAERERDELAEKIDEDYPRPQGQAVYDYFDQVTLWHSKRNFETPSTTLPLTVAELRDCTKYTASDTARQIAKKVFGGETMREAGCASHLDQNLVREILKYTMAKFKLKLKSEEKAIRKGITDACQYEKTKIKQSTAKKVDLTSTVAQTEQLNEEENRRIESRSGTSMANTIDEVNLETLMSI